ncbi:L-serine ammonia-lyase, iron-sulfur-dependent, subunit alpha [Desulfovibrio aminophilus]|uniref:L-serine ammonia-lyase, iron-sulfur-dependent, subunit alpha n=1 Tax=Desulfovibrio aminophilus TaxID=81425 RepID=UPI003394BBCF
MDSTRLYETAARKGLPMDGLTMDDCIELAEALSCPVSEVILGEAAYRTGLDRETVIARTLEAFAHNLRAAELGAESGQSFIMGRVGQELSPAGAPRLIDDAFVNRILVHTLAAQVGNHEIGLQPCAGTGDSCPYTGFILALRERGTEREILGAMAAILAKVGSLFRVGKITTGCNMEGFGAGGAALAAAFTELEGGSPAQVGQAMVLAISPTIGVPCTPRVMVPGLCATHIGGAVLVARLASSLVLRARTLPVTVPVDVMLALAAAVHPISGKHIVPEVIRYMEPFFKKHPGVERYISPEIKTREEARIEAILRQARNETRALAGKARAITDPFGLAVVGGSSQAVGSPTNAGRIAHALSSKEGHGPVRRVIIELYPELFARRGINVPGILMAAAYGSSTDDGAAYRMVMERIAADKIAVDIRMVPDRPQLQKVTIVTDEGETMVETLNRGGARLVLVDSSAGLEAARAAAKELGIEVVDQ